MFVPVTKMVLSELSGAVPQGFEHLANVGSSVERPCGAPGRPTVDRPTLSGYWPVMKAARPAVQDAWA